MDDKHHIYAVDKASGELRHINEVESGNSCNCICAAPNCREALCAKKGAFLKHHFSHQKGANCSAGRYGGGARESIYHYCLKEAIFHSSLIPIYDSNNLNRKTWILLGLESALKEQFLAFTDPEMEKRFRGDCFALQPDVAGVINGQKVAIEITYTHETSDTKIDQLLSLGIETIEITLKHNGLPDIDELVEKRREKDWEGLIWLFKAFINIEWPSRWLEVERIRLSAQILADTKSELALLRDSCDSYRSRFSLILKERDNAIEKIREMEAEKEMFFEEAIELFGDKENEIATLSAEKRKLEVEYYQARHELMYLKSHILDGDKNFDFDALYKVKKYEEIVEEMRRESH